MKDVLIGRVLLYYNVMMMVIMMLALELKQQDKRFE